MTDDLIERFAAATHDYNNISQERRVAQRRVLAALRDSAGVPLAQVDGEAVEGYVGSLVARDFKPSTVGAQLKLIRPFYRWCYDHQIVTADQWLQISAVKPPRGANGGVPRPYKTKEIQRFWRDFDVAYPWSRTGPDTRERGERWFERFMAGTSRFPRARAYMMRTQATAIVALALHGGLRREEIFRLNPEEMHPDEAYVTVHSARKNPDAQQHYRVVPWMSPFMRESVGAWLEMRDRLAPPHDAAWLSLSRTSTYLNSARWRHFRQTVARVPGHWELHRMRHTFATEALRAGMPIEKVQRILGHASIRQTLAYAELVEGDIVDAAARVASRFSRALAHPEETH